MASVTAKGNVLEELLTWNAVGTVASAVVQQANFGDERVDGSTKYLN